MSAYWLCLFVVASLLPTLWVLGEREAARASRGEPRPGGNPTSFTAGSPRGASVQTTVLAQPRGAPGRPPVAPGARQHPTNREEKRD